MVISLSLYVLNGQGEAVPFSATKKDPGTALSQALGLVLFSEAVVTPSGQGVQAGSVL
jgi:hypothetical protein